MPVKLKLHPFPNIFSVMFFILEVDQTTLKKMNKYIKLYYL